jgi:aminoglycoside phosphotransferase (APT) family kinase protein
MTTTARQRTFDAAKTATLEAWLRSALDAPSLAIARAELLGGGAVQENWRIDVVIDDGPRAGPNRWVLRTDAAARLSVSLDRSAEFAVLKLAFDAGVRVAEPIVRCADAEVIGAPFLVQEFLQGEAQAVRLVRSPEVDTWGPKVAAQLGEQLARIHGIHAEGAIRDLLPRSDGQSSKQEVAKLRAAFARLGEPRPALEYVLAWLDRHAPEGPERIGLVHGDFRTGNYMIDGGELACILDWEFAHWGDPDEDIGWLCARCWRFGRTAYPVGGIAQRTAFYDAYERRSGRALDARRIHYWEIMAAAKWAGIAALQGDRFRLGGETSVELALTGLMASEIELEALDGIAKYERKWS